MSPAWRVLITYAACWTLRCIMVTVLQMTCYTTDGLIMDGLARRWTAAQPLLVRNGVNLQREPVAAHRGGA